MLNFIWWVYACVKHTSNNTKQLDKFLYTTELLQQNSERQYEIIKICQFQHT